MAATLATSLVVMSADVSGAAAEEVGDRCVGNAVEAGVTAIARNNGVNGPFPPIVVNPYGGVITRWKAQLAPGVATIRQQMVALHQISEREVVKVGESAVETLVDGVNEFATRIPVPPYANIGLDGPSETLLCEKAEGHIAERIGDPFALGEARSLKTTADAGVSVGVPALAIVEPDADADGYGDTTQDQCPGMPAFHENCPAVTIGLGKPVVSRASIAIPVAIGSPTPLSLPPNVFTSGHVGWRGRAHPVIVSSLSGQKVEAGSTLSIEVPLPKPVRRRLAHLDRRAALTAKLSVEVNNWEQLSSQPTSAALAVRLPGRKRTRHRRP